MKNRFPQAGFPAEHGGTTNAARPDSQHPVHREDGELVGFLTPQVGGWQPRTVFGAPVGGVAEREDAEDWLVSVGLSYLAEPWQWWSGSDWIGVQVVEASPVRVTVQLTDFGHEELYGQRRELPVPVDGILRLA